MPKIVAALFAGLALSVAGITVTHGFTTNPFAGSADTSTPIDYLITFDNDYNGMIGVESAEIDQQNSNDAATSIAGIDARINLHKAFDQQVAAIPFPADRASQQSQVLSTDAAFETSLSQLRNNRNNVPNYNAVLAAEKPIHDAFIAAVQQVGK